MKTLLRLSLLFLVCMNTVFAQTAQDDVVKGIAAYKAADYAQALRLFQKAAAVNNAEAMNKLAVMYEDGKGVPKSLPLAFSWYKKSAEKGSITGMFNLAAMYGAGDGTTQDLAQSFYWYKKAAEGGDAEAMYSTGILLLNGEGTGRNFADAGTWFRAALKNGFDKAKAGLDAVGMEFFNQGLAAYQKQDYTTAFNSYTKAAEFDNLSAVQNLAVMYYKGEGVTANTAEAKKLFSRAAAGGFEMSRQSLAKIEEAEKSSLNAAIAAKSSGSSNTLTANWLSANAKTYVFRSECSSRGKNFTVISRIQADLTKASFDDVKAQVLKQFSNNGWFVQTAPKYLGVKEEVVLKGKAGSDYVVSDGYVN